MPLTATTGTFSDALTATTGAFSDDLAVGTSKLFVDVSTGQVGIGTTSPTSKLDVRGTISTGRNLAREVGTVIAYSSQYTSLRAATNVISGIKNFEPGNSDWLTVSGQRVDAYVVVDLGQAYSVDRMVIYNQNEYANSKREVKGFTLQGSADNSTWTTVLTNECGRSSGHEPNPGWSFRIPASWDDDTEGTSYRYWKFIMNTFHGTDSYGGIMELELYEASDALDDEVSSSSIVAQDVYAETGNFNRGVAIGKGYGGTSTGENNLLVQGNVGIGTVSPETALELHKRFGADSLNSAAEIKFSTNNDSVAWDVGSIRGGIKLNAGGTSNYPGGLVFATKSPGGNTNDLTDKMVIDANGNVGIGTASPSTELEVAGTITIGNGSQLNAIRTDSDGNLQFLRNAASNDSPTITINDDTGNVGVGTTSPGYKLDVNGTVNTSGGIRSYKDGVVAEFQPTTSGSYTLINFHSKVNSGSDKGFILVQDESANSPGSSAEDLRMTIGVHNDFRQSASHSDELWFQGGGRLVYNVGSWDSELDTIIGTAGTGTTGGHEWRVNDSTKMLINHTGNVGIGTTSPGYKLDVNGTVNTGALTATSEVLKLSSGTGTSNAVALSIQNFSSSYTEIENGFGSRIQFRTNRGTSGGSTSQSAEIKGYIYGGAGGSGDYHALDLDAYGDNGSFSRGISIYGKGNGTSILPADVTVHGNLTVDGTVNTGALTATSGTFSGTVNTGALTATSGTFSGTSKFTNILNIQPSSSGGGQNIFTGYRTGDSYGRAQLVLSSGYSDIIIASSQANNNHGSNLSFVAYNPSNAADYRKFVINQGNWGSRKQFLDFGYADIVDPNPHGYINTTNTVLTLDGINKRVGIKNINPGHNLSVTGDAYISSSLECDGRIYADDGCHVRGDWLRVDGNNGIYFESYGGGWHMTDTTWVRSYNSKPIWVTDHIHVHQSDTGVATLSAYGDSQGTGRLYVGQSSTYGGGIEYNGDNSPTSTGAGEDYITLYRVNNGGYDWTARNKYNSNNWEFRGTVTAPTFSGNATSATTATNQSGGSVSATTGAFSQAMYYNEWIRNNGTSASGLYWHNASNPGYKWHIYPENQSDMTFRVGAGNGGIKGTTAEGTVRGYIHWTTSNEIGFLNNGRGWSLRMDSGNNCQVYGSILANGNVTAYSDIRHKEDLNKIDNPLEKIDKLNGYTYTSKRDGKRYTGLVAQEVLEVLPEAVVGDEENGYGLAYGNMAGLFVEAMKDMTKQLQTEKAKVETLETQLASVLARVDALEGA
jgi:hypothetical protein